MVHCTAAARAARAIPPAINAAPTTAIFFFISHLSFTLRWPCACPSSVGPPTTPLLRGVINTLNGRYCCRTSGPLPHSLVRWLFFEGVLVDLLQVEGLPYLNADVVPNHQLGQLFTVDEP